LYRASDFDKKMNASPVRQAWREILPESVCVNVEPLLDEAPSLTVLERLSAGKVDVQRSRELESGRVQLNQPLIE
jgi:hypothetical protein